MDERTLKRELSRLAKELGEKKVCLALQMQGLSPRQSERLSMGDHKGAFRRKTVAAVAAVLSQHRTDKAS